MNITIREYNMKNKTVQDDAETLQEVPIEGYEVDSQTEDEHQQNDSPELNYDEIDPNDKHMDSLEYSFRKIVPMPRSYYWDTSNYNLPIQVKLWHNTIWTGGCMLRCAEKMGEVLANITGINTSKFDYVTCTMTKEQWAAAEKNAQEQKERRKAYLLQIEGQSGENMA